jgi:hypothetical protein
VRKLLLLTTASIVAVLVAIPTAKADALSDVNRLNDDHSTTMTMREKAEDQWLVLIKSSNTPSQTGRSVRLAGNAPVISPLGIPVPAPRIWLVTGASVAGDLHIARGS